VFTRTKHGAKALARQLNRSGVTAVELHGNLSQNARTRNLDDFHAGRAAALVATDIAARGIHVDDVTLVIHADPPADPKAYLHRSGRTARAGNEGTVVTFMTSEQTREVRELTRAAGVRPTTTRIASTADPLLAEIAPGTRTLVEPRAAEPQRPAAPAERSHPAQRSHRSGSRGGRAGRAGKAGKASGEQRQGSSGRARAGKPRDERTPARPRTSHSAAAFSSGRR
jgi:superfamily II DNA/RNA helicase